MPTYIRDLFDLPERVHAGDFVLKLTEGVGDAESTLGSYVVTQQIADCFDQALAFVRDAVQTGSSKAAYLHGSFGAGKSHFMAVLHLLLQSEPKARALEGLAPVVTKHDRWLQGKRFLLVPFHVIGQPSLEAAVLGGYAERVRELHPEAPIPGVYRAEALLRDAEKLRRKLGDEEFFAGLAKGGASGGGGWGELESWDAGAYERAARAAPGSPERSRLVGALVEAYFQSYRDVARGTTEAYLGLDDGLSVISRHARDLGYDALVLFLDELILWLATHATDRRFLNTEGAKISKLVEAESADRPIPIVSFVARQRDLRDLVGPGGTGAEQLAFDDVLRWWEARFDQITLEDRNLAEIAARRLLRPKNEAARQEIDQAWRETEKIRSEVFDILLGPHADRATFRKLYPFSPALVETLVAVSSLLQRERTALKVMLQLLVDQRDTLQLGQIVPVGDLWDVLAEGEEPFTEGMRLQFENAKRLWLGKLLPMLEKEHGIALEEVAKLPYDDPKARAFRADRRLLQTLLLAALVPGVEALRSLDAERLAALNHGSITSPIPGRERQEVLRRLRQWASQVGEIKIAEHESNPTVSLQITGVDTEAVLANAQTVDNAGNRRRKIRDLLFEQLGITGADELFVQHEVTWRGTRRTFQVIYNNVRELPDESLAAPGNTRKAILDYPFDEPGHTPREDLERLETFRATWQGGGKPSRTLVWIPSFLSESAQRELGRLVRCDEVLRSEDNLARYASHLSIADRELAKAILRNQQSALRLKVLANLEAAYGVATPQPGAIDTSHSPAEHFQSLDDRVTLQPPSGGTLREAFEQLLLQMLDAQYPAHPQLAAEPRKSVLTRILDVASQAAQAPQQRVAVEKTQRTTMLQIAVPLRLGEMGETHFALGRHWYDHFQRRFGASDGPLFVGKLREAIDDRVPMGLPREVENLILLLYAHQSNRSFYLHGGAVQPTLDDLRDEYELRTEPLPPEEVWEEAIRLAGRIFGVAISPLRNATNANIGASALAAKAKERLDACQALVDRLASACRDFGVDAGCARLATAKAVLGAVRAIVAAPPDRRFQTLVEAEISTSPEAMATSFEKASAVAEGLARARWQLFEAIREVRDERRTAAEGLLRELAQLLAYDEYAHPLASTLDRLEGDAIRLLKPPATAAPPAPEVGGAAATTAPAGGEVVEAASRSDLDAAGARALLDQLAGRLEAEPTLRLDLEYRLRRTKDEA